MDRTVPSPAPVFVELVTLRMAPVFVPLVTMVTCVRGQSVRTVRVTKELFAIERQDSVGVLLDGQV